MSIIDGKKTFDINGDRFRPGLSISNSEVGLSSLSIAAFVLRLICTNGMVSKTQVAASYRHVSSKILTEMVLMDRIIILESRFLEIWISQGKRMRLKREGLGKT